MQQFLLPYNGAHLYFHAYVHVDLLLQFVLHEDTYGFSYITL